MTPSPDPWEVIAAFHVEVARIFREAWEEPEPHSYRSLRVAADAALTTLREQMEAKQERIDELERMQARSWTQYQMEKGVWTFTLNINRDDGEDVLAHELAHVVQRFRWPDDDVHSDRHAALASDIAAALSPTGEPTKPFYRKGEHPHPTEGNPVTFTEATPKDERLNDPDVTGGVPPGRMRRPTKDERCPDPRCPNKYPPMYCDWPGHTKDERDA